MSQTDAQAVPGPDGEGPGAPVVRDRRRLDPETGQVRTAPSSSAPSAPSAPSASSAPAAEAAGAGGFDEVEAEAEGDVTAELSAALQIAEERLGDLQRLQAEYVNYRRRVDRDRDVARESATSGVLEALLPVLDDVHLARQHGDLQGGPFAAIADKLEAVLGRFGLARYGEAGEEFDPAVHEALMHGTDEAATSTTVTTVLQPGYRVGERVLRPARVAVTGPA
ncbi:nucleotide exchange factor GrpE [Quadrisphaera sp. DSM 44207]|uniref:nucleotide exchange factor GrpE n=1 Tax=Quadrisphaera sp. DSM 44207 TaxID=1881057 RepID=UPI0008829DC4|nr:nucleotide exchange factor GrpE [Quadrisphaera sp. DSM 44207]SDQ88308.1 molecular chaperone GrpE [Quadrisphaera sp. DSM 44207]